MTETLSTSKEVPKTKLALQEKYDQEKKEQSHAKRLDENNIKEVENQLPEPVGYRILVLPFTPKEKTKGGILFSQEQLDKARIATTCGYVIKMSPTFCRLSLISFCIFATITSPSSIIVLFLSLVQTHLILLVFLLH